MRKWIAATAIGAVLGYGMAVYVAPNTVAFAQSDDEAFKELTLFGDIYERIRVAYVEKVDEKELLEAAVNGMLTSLDPHSSYLPPQGYEEMQEQTEGQFGGLGIEVTMEEGVVKVVAPIDDTPAARAGIQAGDLITHLNGEAVMGLTLNDAVDKMRGPVDSEITLTILRESEEEPLEISLKRDIITINPVRARREGDVAYLRITTFNKHAAENLQEKITELKAEIGEENLRGYVLDLRNNPGGLLSQAISVSDTFLDKGEIVSTRGRDPNNAERHNATEGDMTDGKPIVVLVNGGSASASEIVAGALQDHRRAILVGTKSFGKGSVQTIIPLNNDGAIRLTTARYYTPSGRSIQALGIDPDIVVEQLKVEKPEANGRRRNEASLRGALNNDTVEEGAEPDEATSEEKVHRDELRTTDYQLSYALDLLAGFSAFDRLRQQ